MIKTLKDSLHRYTGLFIVNPMRNLSGNTADTAALIGGHLFVFVFAQKILHGQEGHSGGSPGMTTSSWQLLQCFALVAIVVYCEKYCMIDER